MSRSDPTGRAYRDALVHVRAATPDVAKAITVHVTHLERLVARLQLEQREVDARVRELVAIKTSDGHEAASPDLVVVTHDQQPLGMSSPDAIVEAAMALVEELMKSDDGDPSIAITATGVRYGPMEAPILGVALRFVVEQMRPVVATIRAATGQPAPWPWA